MTVGLGNLIPFFTWRVTGKLVSRAGGYAMAKGTAG